MICYISYEGILTASEGVEYQESNKSRIILFFNAIAMQFPADALQGSRKISIENNIRNLVSMDPF